jgi:parallel beta-helix repeat protein
LISGNVVTENGDFGIHISLVESDGATVIDNTITANKGYGIEGDHDGWGGYARNVLNRNNASGQQVKGGVQMGGNVCGGALCQ